MGVKAASGVVVALGFLLSSCASDGARGGAQGVTAGSSLAVTVSSGLPSAAPVAPKSSPVVRPIVTSSPTPPATVAPIPSTAVFGYPSVGVLTAAAPRPGDHAAVPEATAVQQIEHPLSSPRVAGPPRIVGLARVTAVGGSLSFDGPGPASSVHDMLAWVGAYELDRNADPKCPPEPTGPASPPASLPPLMAHYYFVVLVDASTAQVISWQEDASGLVIRQCAGLPVT